jgi:hypothetical protein
LIFLPLLVLVSLVWNSKPIKWLFVLSDCTGLVRGTHNGISTTKPCNPV